MSIDPRQLSVDQGIDRYRQFAFEVHHSECLNYLERAGSRRYRAAVILTGDQMEYPAPAMAPISGYPTSNRDTYTGGRQIILPPPTAMNASTTYSNSPYARSYNIQRAAIPSQWGPSASSGGMIIASSSIGITNNGQGGFMTSAITNVGDNFAFGQQSTPEFGQQCVAPLSDIIVKTEPEDPAPMFTHGSLARRQSSRPQWRGATAGLVVGGGSSYFQQQPSPVNSGHSAPYTAPLVLPNSQLASSSVYGQPNWQSDRTVTSRTLSYRAEDEYEIKSSLTRSSFGFDGSDPSCQQSLYPRISIPDSSLPTPSSNNSPFLLNGEDWAPSPVNDLGAPGGSGWTSDDSYESHAGHDSSIGDHNSWAGDGQVHDGDDAYGAVILGGRGETIDGQQEAEAFTREYTESSTHSSKSPYQTSPSASSRSSSEDVEGKPPVLRLAPGEYANSPRSELSEAKLRRREAKNAAKRKRAIPNERIPAPIPDLSLIKKTRGRTVATSPSEVPSNVVHVCPIPKCGACFRRREHVKRHIRGIHTHEKPFACSVPGCDKRFSRRDNRMTHVLKAHKADAKTASVAVINVDKRK